MMMKLSNVGDFFQATAKGPWKDTRLITWGVNQKCNELGYDDTHIISTFRRLRQEKSETILVYIGQDKLHNRSLSQKQTP